MNGLIKQLFTPNSPVAQLSEHKTREGPAAVGSNPGILQNEIDVTTSWCLVVILLFCNAIGSDIPSKILFCCSTIEYI